VSVASPDLDQITAAVSVELCGACGNSVAAGAEERLCADCHAGGDVIADELNGREAWARFLTEEDARAYIVRVAPNCPDLTLEVLFDAYEETPDRPWAVVSDDLI
jgi:hypothetical protein